jgi:alanine racemase
MNLQDVLEGKRPTWVTVNLDSLESNYWSVRKALDSHVKIMAVVKANAYGHGAVPVAQRLEKCGADYLAVAILEEAIELRRKQIRLPILLLSGFWPGQEEEIIRQSLTPAVFNERMVEHLVRAAKCLKKEVKFHIKIDTGMTRLGVDWEEATRVVEGCSPEEWASCEGIYTHLSSAEIADDPFSRLQIERFRNIIRSLCRDNFAFLWRHVANSAGILNFPESWCNGVRPGLLLYGINPLTTPPRLPVESILTFKTRIMQLKRVKKGTSVGYGGDYTVSQESVIATLPVGYADGFNRLLSNRGSVLTHGQRAPIVGRISMDLTLVDVTAIKDVRVGDEVVLIGKQGLQEITAKEIAGLTRTIPYEVLCGISQRVPRFYAGA